MDNSEDLLMGVIETVDIAKKHRMQLEELLESLNSAENQVKTSADKCEGCLQAHFTALKVSVCKALDDRLSELMSQVQDIEQKAVIPLQQSVNIVKNDIALTTSVLNQGKELLMKGDNAEETSLIKYKTKSNELGLNRLPEVPPLWEVACIFADLPAGVDKALCDGIRDYGRVMSRAPVQITEINERPGGLSIKWHEIEEEHVLDLSEFWLQYCYGAVSINDNQDRHVFHDAYQGSNCSHVIRHLQPCQSYTLRVCGRAEGAGVWSPWSIPQVAMSSLPPYDWREGTHGYIISNQGQIATRDENVSEASLPLFSQQNPYCCGHSIIFKILDSGSTEPDDGIWITRSNDDNAGPLDKATLFVSFEGCVFMDGQEKLTKMPPLKRGSVLTFDTEVLDSGKVRVTIEVNEKIVTFDWSVDPSNSTPPNMCTTSLSSTESNVFLYFAVRCIHPDWKISVE